MGYLIGDFMNKFIITVAIVFLLIFNAVSEEKEFNNGDQVRISTDSCYSYIFDGKNLIQKFMFRFGETNLKISKIDSNIPDSLIQVYCEKLCMFPLIGKKHLLSANNSVFIVQDSIRKEKEKEEEKRIFLEEEKVRHERDSIINLHPKKFRAAIINHEIILGMNKAQINLSWGEPEDIHRTVGSWGVHEQWIYGDKYLYLENGILTSFQD